MLLSRALNRGYGMSRYRWPMHFGLLNNDCLWVMDETQLMGVGVETSAQLDGFRHLANWLRQGPCPTWWMSATLEDSRLATVDHPTPPGGWPRLELGDKDREAVQHRLKALKRLHQAPLSITKQTKPAVLANFVLEKHIHGQLTLVIVNRVQRAQEIFKALQKAGRKDHLALVHSRFRAPDRQIHQDLLLQGTGDRIVVATQAVEAGVDVSARVLITEIAPWSSLVQRFGRCNRGGEFNVDGADVYWLDLEFDKDTEVAPYTLKELKDARTELKKLESHIVSPEALSSVQVIPPPVIRPVIRRKDLIDLFDTTPDIAGHDLDISRYIREGEDTDVQVFWRDLSATDFLPHPETPDPAPEELCRVAVPRFQDFLNKLNKAKDGRNAYAWDGLNAKWKPETKARAGATYLLDHRAGGYDLTLGWTGEVAELKKPSEWTAPLAVKGKQPADANSRDPLTWQGLPLLLEHHTAHVVKEMEALLQALSLEQTQAESLLNAARWHDVGKSLADFQTMLRAVAGENAPDGILAKSGSRGGSLPDWRKHFRHELASALAWLAHHDGEPHANLVAYLIAAHHGKVRLSIRSLPEEQPPQGSESTLIARGILDGDELPEISLPNVTMPRTTLRLDLMHMGLDAQGRPSWLARMITLRDQLGPFALAYLETLLRSADMRASAAEVQSTPQL
jgi:CRISPR-associated endonuclease/helicase Cas3